VDLREIASRRGVPLRILVTRLRYLGDVILTTPVLGALRSCYPGAELFFLTERPYAPVLRGHPDLAGVIEAERSAAGSLRVIAALRRLRLSAAIDLLYNPRSAAILRFSQIPVRIGGGRRGRRRLYTHLFTPLPGTRSAVSHHLSALSVIGCAVPDDPMPSIALEPGEIEAGVAAIARITGRVPTPCVAMHPGGTWPAKRWPEESFTGLAGLVRDHAGAGVILVTGPGEEGITARIAARAGPGVHALPVMPVREAAGILAACDAVVANDGGVMHLAVALGRPTVGVFGPTEPDIWFPYEGRGPYRLVTRREPCAPCHLHSCDDMRCLATITAGEVFEALRGVTGW
jgi:lipopolysaccharide heptosyltransferase II